MMSHALTQIHVRNVSQELNEELHPISCHKSFAQNSCLGHTFNGCFAKRASTLNAKVSLFILSDPGQHRKGVV